MIKVLLVDDHEMVRLGVSSYLSIQEDIEVIGEAENGRQGYEKAMALRPDVILMDLVMEEMDGIESTKAILKDWPKAKIIIVTSFIDDEHDIEAKITDHIMLFGDSGLIKELIRILMDNALKYTPEGGKITLSCVIAQRNIILSIKDNGMGIPKEHIPHLFERFYRVDEARSKSTGGTGLGLAIAKQIITVHDAQISVTSELGQGTEFIIFFSK